VLYTNPVYSVTPLICAAYAGAIESVNFLLTNGADASAHSKSLIHWTVKGGSISCLIKFFDMSIIQQPPDLCSLITKDALADNLEMLKCILKYYPGSAFKEVSEVNLANKLDNVYPLKYIGGSRLTFL